MPEESLGYLKPGDAYALGGILIHLMGSLDGYSDALDALRAAGFGDTTGPAARPDVVEAQLARAKAGLARGERAPAFAALRAKHRRLAELAATIADADFVRIVGLLYPGDDEPYPTSAALVVQWMREHYDEHVPHARELFQTWRSTRPRA